MNKKRLTSALLSAVLLNGSLTGYGVNSVSILAAEAEPWDGTSTDTTWYSETGTEFNINTAKELAGLAKLVNSGKDFSGKTVILQSDINLNNQKWSPIGTTYRATNSSETTRNKFNGIFNGNGHSIFKINLDAYSNSNIDGVENASHFRGLFGTIGLQGQVLNLTMTQGMVFAYYNDTGAGAIAGNNQGLIENCTGNIFVYGYGPIGGIAGTNSGIISKCSSTYILEAYENTTPYGMGGIVGNNQSGGKVINCLNTAKLDSGTNQGGIAGINEGTIENCLNIGESSSTYTTPKTIGGLYALGEAQNSVNSYYIDSFPFNVTNEGSRTPEQLASGSVCWDLEADTPGVWGQTLEIGRNDINPILTDDLEKTVYLVEYSTANDQTHASADTPSYFSNAGTMIKYTDALGTNPVTSPGQTSPRNKVFVINGQIEHYVPNLTDTTTVNVVITNLTVTYSGETTFAYTGKNQTLPNPNELVYSPVLPERSKFAQYEYRLVDTNKLVGQSVKDAGTYSVKVVVNLPLGNGIMAYVPQSTITITIEQITPTIKNINDLCFTSGQVLGDFPAQDLFKAYGLNDEEIPGTFEWVEDPSSVLEDGESYIVRFTPTSSNYETVEIGFTFTKVQSASDLSVINTLSDDFETLTLTLIPEVKDPSKVKWVFSENTDDSTSLEKNGDSLVLSSNEFTKAGTWTAYYDEEAVAPAISIPVENTWIKKPEEGTVTELSETQIKGITVEQLLSLLNANAKYPYQYEIVNGSLENALEVGQHTITVNTSSNSLVQDAGELTLTYKILPANPGGGTPDSGNGSNTGGGTNTPSQPSTPSTPSAPNNPSTNPEAGAGVNNGATGSGAGFTEPGSVTKPAENGGSTTFTQEVDGTKSATTTDSAGNVTDVQVTVPSTAIKDGFVSVGLGEDAKGETIKVPGNVSQDSKAPEVTISLPSDVTKTTVEFQLQENTGLPGTVAMVEDENGNLIPIVNSTVIGNELYVPISGGKTKIIIKDNSKSFSDVAADQWYGNAVAFITAREIMNGSTGEGSSTFAPNETLTRAMLAQMIANMEGQPNTSATTNPWYLGAQRYVVGKGLMGVGSSFNPDDPITRQDLAVVLWRNAGSPQVNTEILNEYSDKYQVSNYALQAVAWAVENDIMGVDSPLNATNNATRAEIARMFMAYITGTTLK